MILTRSIFFLTCQCTAAKSTASNYGDITSQLMSTPASTFKSMAFSPFFSPNALKADLGAASPLAWEDDDEGFINHGRSATKTEDTTPSFYTANAPDPRLVTGSAPRMRSRNIIGHDIMSKEIMSTPKTPLSKTKDLSLHHMDSLCPAEMDFKSPVMRH